ncbi:hypothetical protein [Vibrio sp. HB161653]|nr:hypothetical protein [Vibrio sp. HB161653]MDP5254297.1 hypothetical protein [Vibrio sp. HB161653]
MTWVALINVAGKTMKASGAILTTGFNELEAEEICPTFHLLRFICQ